LTEAPRSDVSISGFAVRRERWSTTRPGGGAGGRAQAQGHRLGTHHPPRSGRSPGCTSRRSGGIPQVLLHG
jgi:hypothetical protein